MKREMHIDYSSYALTISNKVPIKEFGYFNIFVSTTLSVRNIED
jgi:hypothetical protein